MCIQFQEWKPIVGSFEINTKLHIHWNLTQRTMHIKCNDITMVILSVIGIDFLILIGYIQLT